MHDVSGNQSYLHDWPSVSLKESQLVDRLLEIGSHKDTLQAQALVTVASVLQAEVHRSLGREGQMLHRIIWEWLLIIDSRHGPASYCRS
jgi:hypothetical protein